MCSKSIGFTRLGTVRVNSKVKIYDLGVQVQGGGRGEGCTMASVDWGKKSVSVKKKPKLEKNAYFDLFEEVYHKGQYMIKTFYLFSNKLVSKTPLISRSWQ